MFCSRNRIGWRFARIDWSICCGIISCADPRASWGYEIRWGYVNRVCLGSRAESCLRCWMPKKWWHLRSGRNSSQGWLNAHALQIRMDAWLLLELWCGQSVLPLDDSSMVIGTINANLGPQIVVQDCGWAALTGFCFTWRLKAEKRLQLVTNAL